MKQLSVGIVIPTWKAEKHLFKCLPPLINSSLKPRILIIDSTSNDGTVEMAQSLGVETRVIPQEMFNHGKTREMGRKLLQTDIVLMITQDAYLENPEDLHKLIQPILDGKAAVSYARQLPHQGAEYLESFAREYNYPKNSQLRSINDIHEFGSYTFFCSNSCAAYLNSALDEVKGFPEVLFGEDTAVVIKLLENGYRIAYVAECCVRHSHSYSLKQEFKRHFDIGYSRQKMPGKYNFGAKDEERGKSYVRSLFGKLEREKPSLIPYAALQIVAKFAGYKLGRKSVNAPTWFKKWMSSQKSYWQ